MTGLPNYRKKKPRRSGALGMKRSASSWVPDGDGTGGAMDANKFFVWIVFPLVFWAAMISSFLPPNAQVLTMLASLLP